MKTLFPLIRPQPAVEDGGLPMCREIKWDFKQNRAVFRRGEPEVVEGAEAVAVWAWLTLHTPRFRHEIYTWAYGSELETLIGQPYTEALKRAEAQRYVRETLEGNPYIRSVDQVDVSFSDGKLFLSCLLTTIYGKREVTGFV